MHSFVASQLRKPSGFFGRHLALQYMNRSNAELNRRTIASRSPEPDDRVLEVGFGAGDLISRIAPMLAKGSVAGVDYSPKMVALCTRRFASLVAAGRVKLRCANAEAIPYGAGHFSKACTANAIYFWPDPAVPLRELWRVLQVGGRLVVGFVPQSTMGKFRTTKYGFTLSDPDQISRLLEDAGFRDIEMVSGADKRGEFFCAIGTKQDVGGAWHGIAHNAGSA
jgi:SAM-dependent methyltransferase